MDGKEFNLTIQDIHGGWLVKFAYPNGSITRFFTTEREALEYVVKDFQESLQGLAEEATDV